MRVRDLNPFWRQLPVYSPVTFRSLWTGLAGALGWGRPLERLQELLATEYGTAEMLLLDSGTSALRLAIEGSLVNTASDIVALPAYCCFDVATAAVGADARVALYDVRPETLGPDFDSMRAALDAGARTLVVAHLYGVPADLDASRELAGAYNAVLIEDAAQGAGGSWRGRPLGTWGDLGILSFGRGKGRTGGGGGALLANSDSGARILRDLNGAPPAESGGIWTIAKLSAQWALGRPSLYGIPASLTFLGLGETKFKEPWCPEGMAPGPAAALLANWELSKAEEVARRNRSHAERIERYEKTGEAWPFQIDERGVAGSLRIPRLIDERSLEELGMSELSPPYPSLLSDLPVMKRRLIGSTDGWRAAELCKSLRTSPSHSRGAWRATGYE
jgi:perosamine synthetase